MAKGKKISMINIIVLAVLVVCLVLAIVGLSVDKWTDVKVNEDRIRETNKRLTGTSFPGQM